jgi:hypothetical protein
VDPLSLADLPTDCPLLVAAAGQHIADAAAVCLAEQGHGCLITRHVTGAFCTSYLLDRSEVTGQMRASCDECGEAREAERLIAIALSGDSPAEIAAELRELWQVVCHDLSTMPAVAAG